MKNELFLKQLCRIAQKAGAAILEHYQQDVEVQRKADASPVTVADLAAHHVIMADLAALTPDIPIVSEEQAEHVLPKDCQQFWLVDPLDGTKSFIRHEDEFTVNIGLIENGVPTLGVIDVPAQSTLYYGAVGIGCWRQRGDEDEAQSIQTRALDKQALAAVVSLSHLDEQTQEFLAPYQVASRVAAASSLKFCRVAEGSADIYPRFGPTMEWDTAAGHAILSAAGGRVERPDGSPFTYGKDELRNGAFVAWGE